MRLQQLTSLVGLAVTVQAGHAKWETGFGTGIGTGGVAPVSTEWITSVVRKFDSWPLLVSAISGQSSS